MTGKIKLEACVDSLASAIAAESGGAYRIELCDCLQVGGTTPSFGMLELVRARLSIPIHVLIRPRAGDFCYSDDELLIMEHDIAMAKRQGADGIVCGVLNPEGTVNKVILQRLITLTRPLSFTFHRAFDMVADPEQALEDLVSLGVDCVLTSGQQPTAFEGRELIARLVKQAGRRITIMPGGGITENNVAALVQLTGARYIHASARSYQDGRMEFRRTSVNMGSYPLDEFGYSFTTPERVKAILSAASNL